MLSKKRATQAPAPVAHFFNHRNIKINDYDTHAHPRHDDCMPRQSLSTRL